MLRAVLALMIVWMAVAHAYGWSVRPAPRYAAGMVAPAAPRQELLHDAAPWRYREFVIQPLARFELVGRVLLTSRYYFDTESQIAPIDILFGWGPLSDQRVLDTLTLRMGYRSYQWRATELLLPYREINRHMANMHLMPADDSVLRTLRSAEPGQVLRIRGSLIEATREDGWRWRSSLTRSDAGRGACELVWVERATFEESPIPRE